MSRFYLKRFAVILGLLVFCIPSQEVSAVRFKKRARNVATLEILVKDLDPFFSELVPQSHSLFANRLESLKQRMTFVDSAESLLPSRWQVWLTTRDSTGSEVWFGFVLTQQGYDSQIASEADLKQILSLDTPRSYVVLKMFQYISHEDQPVIFQMLMDDHGNYNELFHLQKSSIHSGKQVFEIYRKLVQFLGIQKSVLLDDAKVFQKDPTTGQELPFYLKQFMPIVSNAAQTFYESLAPFTPLEFSAPLEFGTNHLSSQNVLEYRAAVEHIRNATLTSLSNEVFSETLSEKFNARQAYLRVWMARYPGATVHEVGKKIYDSWRSNPSSASFNEFSSFYHLVLTPDPVLAETSYPASYLKWNSALETLQKYRVWVWDIGTPVEIEKLRWAQSRPDRVQVLDWYVQWCPTVPHLFSDCSRIRDDVKEAFYRTEDEFGKMARLPFTSRKRFEFVTRILESTSLLGPNEVPISFASGFPPVMVSNSPLGTLLRFSHHHRFRGAYKDGYLVIQFPSWKPFARLHLKLNSTRLLSSRNNAVMKFNREAAFLYELSSELRSQMDGVPKTYAFEPAATAGGGVIYQEYFPYDLFDFLSKNRGLDKFPASKKAALSILFDILKIVSAFHQQGFVHRDLKPENILIRPAFVGAEFLKYEVAISDFGNLAKRSDPEFQTSVRSANGTLEYMAPEKTTGILKGSSPEERFQNATKEDVYSMCAVIYQVLISKVIPWGRPPGTQFEWNYVWKKNEMVNQIVSTIDEDFISTSEEWLLAECFRADETQRMNSQQLLAGLEYLVGKWTGNVSPLARTPQEVATWMSLGNFLAASPVDDVLSALPAGSYYVYPVEIEPSTWIPEIIFKDKRGVVRRKLLDVDSQLSTIHDEIEFLKRIGVLR